MIVLLLCAPPLLGGCAGDADDSLNAEPSDPFTVAIGPEAPPGQNDVVFTPPGGGFTGTVTLSLGTPGGAATVHYTLDGSIPSAASPSFEGPLTLSETTQVRAVSVLDGVVVTALAQTYVALEADAAEFSSNLPIVLLERHGDRPIETDGNELRGSSALTFEPPNGGRARLLGPATLSTRAGVRVRGQSSRGFPQKSYAVELWEAERDEDRKVSWLGMPAESDFTLIAPSEMDRSLMRTMLPMDLSRAIGSYAPRTRFVEVFLVDREGSRALSYGDYLGVFTATEKIKRDPNRVNVAKLEPTDLTLPAVSGGYLFRIDHGGAHFDAGGYGFQWEYPDASEFEGGARAPQREYLQDTLDDFFSALRSGGDYASFIDVPRFIDHNLLVALTKNVDGLRLSAYFHKDRGGSLVAGPIWDFDRSQGTPYDGRATRADDWSEGDGTHPLTEMFWGDLFERAEFATAYWNRWAELSRLEFSAASIVQRIDGYEALLAEARERHFERWPQFPPEGGPEGEVEILRNFYRERVQWLSSQRP